MSDSGDLTKLTKLTVNLVPGAKAALKSAAALSGDTMTDTVNLALQAYASILELAASQGPGGLEYTPDLPGREPVTVVVRRKDREAGGS